MKKLGVIGWLYALAAIVGITPLLYVFGFQSLK